MENCTVLHLKISSQCPTSAGKKLFNKTYREYYFSIYPKSYSWISFTINLIFAKPKRFSSIEQQEVMLKAIGQSFLPPLSIGYIQWNFFIYTLLYPNFKDALKAWYWKPKFKLKNDQLHSQLCQNSDSDRKLFRQGKHLFSRSLNCYGLKNMLTLI